MTPQASDTSLSVDATCAEGAACRAALPELAEQPAWQSVRLGSGAHVPVQLVDTDSDGSADLAMFVSGPADGPYALSTRPVVAAKPEVQVVLSQRAGGSWQDGVLRGGDFVDVDAIALPGWHEPGNGFLRYEGPAWESTEVGYRLYLDERNTIDIFGKQKAALALDAHGRDGDDYHALQDWGADILKVGDSLGMGTPGLLVGEVAARIDGAVGIAARVLDNGPYFARFAVTSKGWQAGEGAPLDVTTHYAIEAGSRLTHITLNASAERAGWVAGIGRHDSVAVLASSDAAPWQYVATLGEQALFPGQLGMAIFYRKGDAAPGSDALNELVRFAGRRSQLDYFAGAWWQGDPSGLRDASHFRQLLDAERDRLVALGCLPHAC